MCGIAGFWAKYPEHGEAVIRDMLNQLKPRGPDGTSWLTAGADGHCQWRREADMEHDRRPVRMALGCSRLAINDVSDAGLQPISDDRNSVWVVLNGEIFNFVELRNELESLGRVFRTRTDTEVVASAYAQWGAACLHRFNGQFAIAAYEPGTGRLMLARDRIGIVPLYFHASPNGMVFGSEIKALLQVPGIERLVNPNHAATLIGLPYKLHGLTGGSLFQGIEPVRPGHYVLFDAPGPGRIECYWSAHTADTRPEGGFLENRERLRALLIDSVRLRLRSDRRVAFIVSGGIDSSAVAGIASQQHGFALETFSLEIPDARFDERSEIREVVTRLNGRNTFIPVTVDTVRRLLPEVLGRTDEPYATPNAILHAQMAACIRASGYNVVLNGVGGDEAFLGYHDHFLYFLHELEMMRHTRFESERLIWSRTQNRPLALYDRFRDFLGSEAWRHSPDFLARSGGHDYRELLSPALRPHLFEKSLFEQGDMDTRRKQIADLTKLTIPHTVRMDDGCYLAQAIEARQPFLDHRLIEFGLSLPPGQKVRGGFSKFLLRSAVRGFVPPARRRDRRKVGLNFPIDTWMRGPLKEWFRNRLLDGGPLNGYVDMAALARLWEQHQSGEANHCLKIWDIASLAQCIENRQRPLQDLRSA